MANEKKFESLEEAIKHIEDLNKELEAEKKAAGNAMVQVKDLIQKIEAGKVALKEANAALAVEKELAASALEQVAEMGAKLDLLEKHKGSEHSLVTIGKEAYKLIGKKFRTSKGVLTAQELAHDEDVLKDMLKKGSGALVPVE